MAAAPDFPMIASPELALVDAALASELRLMPPPPGHAHSRLLAGLNQAPLVADPHALPNRRSPEARVDRVTFEAPSDEPHERQATDSHYPALPAPERELDGITEMDAALQRIRERLMLAPSY